MPNNIEDRASSHWSGCVVQDPFLDEAPVALPEKEPEPVGEASIVNESVAVDEVVNDASCITITQVESGQTTDGLSRDEPLFFRCITCVSMIEITIGPLRHYTASVILVGLVLSIKSISLQHRVLIRDDQSRLIAFDCWDHSQACQWVSEEKAWHWA